MPDADFDVLILGDHPAAVALALLLAERDASVLRAARASNTLFFADQPSVEVLHPAATEILPTLTDFADQVPTAGVRLLGPDAATGASWHAEASQGTIVDQQALTAFIDGHATAAGATTRTRPIEILTTDRQGVLFKEGATERRAKLVVIADPMPEALLKPLGLRSRPSSHRLLHRTFGNDARVELPQLVAALDVETGTVARLMAGVDGKPEATLFVRADHDDPAAVMDRWCARLVMHDLVTDGRPGKITAADVALAGALDQDMVGDRTLMIGPAGGFVSAFGESLYPGIWSALFAADAVSAALDAEFPQEALQDFRGVWGASLGDYLRGPQQNLPFLLPLIYTNEAMMARLGKAMLLGEPLVH